MASSAEKEIRDAVTAWWHKNEPRGRVIHELPLSGFSSEGRADIGIIFPDVIVLVEIKSERDKLVRLEKQFYAMKARSHAFQIICHDKWFGADGRLKDQDWMLYSHREHVLRYPEPPLGAWRFDRYRITAIPHPSYLLNMLWADELRQIGGRKDLNMQGMVFDLCRSKTGREITEAVCAALRGRTFAEADPPICGGTAP